jgi:deazaflavin-dependent oxidoreductase (nitroreductase family)
VTDAGDRARRQRILLMQRYLLNPPMKFLAWLGVSPGHTLIETHGRRTGKRRRTVVGIHVEDGTGWIVAEQGRHAGYVRNLQSDPNVRVRLRGRWRDGHAEVVPDDDPQDRLDGFGRRSHASAVRRFGTELMTVRVDLTSPTPDDDPPSS